MHKSALEKRFLVQSDRFRTTPFCRKGSGLKMKIQRKENTAPLISFDEAYHAFIIHKTSFGVSDATVKNYSIIIMPSPFAGGK